MWRWSEGHMLVRQHTYTLLIAVDYTYYMYILCLHCYTEFLFVTFFPTVQFTHLFVIYSVTFFVPDICTLHFFHNPIYTSFRNSFRYIFHDIFRSWHFFLSPIHPFFVTAFFFVWDIGKFTYFDILKMQMCCFQVRFWPS